jgi:hypothetical protein
MKLAWTNKRERRYKTQMRLFPRVFYVITFIAVLIEGGRSLVLFLEFRLFEALSGVLPPEGFLPL